MKAKLYSVCTCAGGCTSSGRGGSTRAALFAGALGGIIAFAAVAILGVALFRRLGPRMMPRMMARMMRDCECSPEMKACMEKCGCGPRTEDRPDS